jgi:mRNA-degrading endonuclease toxin of MazEF toxin-antitoxin module
LANLADVGPHPVVLVSRDATYRIRNQATVALITSRIRGIPVEVLIGESEGLAPELAVNVDNLATIDLAALTERIGALPPSKMRALDAALHFALGLSY